MIKRVYLMCGPAGSGKTTWAKKMATATQATIISRDDVRFSLVKEDEPYFSKEDEVYATFIQKINDALIDSWSEEIYIDSTNLTPKARKRLINQLQFAPGDQLIAVVVMPELETVLAQNRNRTGRQRVPDSVVENMWYSFVSPENDNINYTTIIERIK